MRATLLSLLLAFPLLAQDAPMPPELPWNGASKQLVVASGDRWITPSEASGFRTTPTYDETVAWLRKLVAAAPELKMVSIGKSPQGRDIWMIVASRKGGANKPTFLAQGGIHAGEIDGKDAGLMLLRDMTVRGTKRELLDRANFLFVPIFNVDGHERSSPFNRVNQRGPENMGWRTNARNLNLNRDYMKAETDEIRAMLRVLDEYKPDLYADLHVTDGADYQYDVTFGWNGPQCHSPAIATWLNTTFRPAADRDLRAAGHIPGPLIFAIDDNDLSKGILNWMSDPRFSHGYGDARHLPTILVENHSLKPYAQRVLGTYVFLESALRTLGAHGSELRAAVDSDRARRVDTVPLSWRVPESQNTTVDFLAVESRTTLSPISGDLRIEYLGKPVTQRIPYRDATEVATSVARPKAYWVPAAWKDAIEKLRLHGIQMETLAAPREVDVEMLRLEEPKFESQQFEGRVRVTAKPVAEKRHERFAAGSVRVPTDQPLGALAVLLLEPASPDSLFQWGFFNSVLSPTEYIEGYIMEPLAERMLANDPKLAAEFREKIATDGEFRGSARARLAWFYRKTPYYDERARLYPVGRE